MQLERLKNSYRALYHASIYLDKGIYFDPYLIKEESHDAKYLFITHSHFDHLSINDINKVINDKTIFIATKDSIEILKKSFNNQMIEVRPNQEYHLGSLSFTTIRAYNQVKPYHPYSNDWVGYLLHVNEFDYYIVGDSDYNEEMNQIKCDVLFVPIGGKYTMDYQDAAQLTNAIKPKIVVPIHFNTLADLQVNKRDFISLISNEIIID